jgi:hypothetical protein
MEQSLLFLWRQIRHALKIEGNCFLERTEYFFEGAALNRDVELEADCLPGAVRPSA